MKIESVFLTVGSLDVDVDAHLDLAERLIVERLGARHGHAKRGGSGTPGTSSRRASPRGASTTLGHTDGTTPGQGLLSCGHRRQHSRNPAAAPATTSNKNLGMVLLLLLLSSITTAVARAYMPSECGL